MPSPQPVPNEPDIMELARQFTGPSSHVFQDDIEICVKATTLAQYILNRAPSGDGNLREALTEIVKQMGVAVLHIPNGIGLKSACEDAVRQAKEALATPPLDGWTPELKRICEGRCADYGDPPCWKLPELTSDMKTKPKPCAGCLDVAPTDGGAK